ncbi:hypothetical protein Y032_0522g2902 [Ancylostoma ceylanicum]|uniref:Uncharacterized protein n=1 Tax=Ancylostoma ceylanicum TaxID=53326 RepID=A0A016WS89_9BILA|nr:hypothetical protein Y032_0522g2902 [Ancylostoma ceylanicum]
MPELTDTRGLSDSQDHCLGRFRASLDLNGRRPLQIKSRRGITYDVETCVTRVDMGVDVSEGPRGCAKCQRASEEVHRVPNHYIKCAV